MCRRAYRQRCVRFPDGSESRQDFRHPGSHRHQCTETLDEFRYVWNSIEMIWRRSTGTTVAHVPAALRNNARRVHSQQNTRERCSDDAAPRQLVLRCETVAAAVHPALMRTAELSRRRGAARKAVPLRIRCPYRRGRFPESVDNRRVAWAHQQITPDAVKRSQSDRDQPALQSWAADSAVDPRTRGGRRCTVACPRVHQRPLAM